MDAPEKFSLLQEYIALDTKLVELPSFMSRIWEIFLYLTLNFDVQGRGQKQGEEGGPVFSWFSGFGWGAVAGKTRIGTSKKVGGGQEKYRTITKMLIKLRPLQMRDIAYFVGCLKFI